MKKFIRSTIVIGLFGIFGIGALFIQYLIFPFQKNEREKYNTLQKSWEFFVWLLQKTEILKIEISNIEKIKNIKNSIIVSTHPSFADIIILMSLIPNSTCFVAERLTKNPFLKGIVKTLFIPEASTIDVWLNKACEKLNEGFNVIIFPMGIRHREFETPKIRRGAALIAQKSERNIVMLNMKTSFDFLQINQPFYQAGEETVLFNIDYSGEINTTSELRKYPEDVTFRTQITKQITKTLYKNKK